MAGNPIHIADGNKYQQETDYRGPGVFPLEFIRHYNSHAYWEDWLGHGWRVFGFVEQVGVAHVAVQRPDHKGYLFTLTDGHWTSDTGDNLALARLTDSEGHITGWALTFPDGLVEHYGADGRPLSFTQPNGLAHTIEYVSASRSVLRDSYGRRLTLDLDSQGRLATLTTPAGQLYRYGYDGMGNLETVTYPDDTPGDDSDNPVRRYHYEDPRFPHALTGITDENGDRYATWRYDEQGRAISSEHAGGAERVDLTYNPDGSTHVTDAYGATRAYRFTTLHGVIRGTGVSQPGGSGCDAAASVIGHDANGNVKYRADFAGHLTCHTHDPARNLETRRQEGLRYDSAQGGDCPGTPVAGVTRTVTTAWHPIYRLPTQVAEPLRTTLYSYDDRGNLTQIKIHATNDADGSQGLAAPLLGSGRVWSLGYTDYGRLTTLNGPRTDVTDRTTYTYYPLDDPDPGRRGQLWRITTPLGHTTEILAYDPDGRPIEIRQPNGRLDRLAYTPRGQLAQLTQGEEITRYTYDPVGQLIRVDLPDGGLQEFAYDAAHRRIARRDPQGNEIDHVPYAPGQREEERHYTPDGTLVVQRALDYDPLGRIWRRYGAQGQTSTHEYDANGNLTRLTNPLNHATAYAYDEHDRLTRVTDPLAGVIQLSHDGQDQVSQVTDPDQLATTYSHSGLGGLRQETSPDRGTLQYTYDSAGNLKTRTDARGIVLNYFHDAQNRLTRISRDGATLLEFTWDTDVPGYPARLADPAGSTTWTRDAHGRVIVKTQTRLEGDRSESVQYAYAPGGALARITYPSGRVVDYVRENGYLTAIRIDGQLLLDAYRVQPDGTPSAWDWHTPILAEPIPYRRDFDLDGRLTAHPLADTRRLLGHDAADRITDYSHPGAPELDRHLEYDPLDRLTRITGAPNSRGYQIDAGGDRTRADIGANSYAYTYVTGSHRLQGIAGPVARTYTHDAAGNVLGDGTYVYTWDALGRLTQVDQAGVSHAYRANGFNQRLEKSGPTLPDGPRRFVYDEAGRLLGEYDASGPVQETVWIDDLPVAVMKSGKVYRIETDHLNTPRVIRAPNDRLVWRWDTAEPFGGNLPQESPDGLPKFNYNPRMPGQYYDVESKLFYNWNRYYDPQSGRYISSDPIGLAGGINLYQYANANPLTFTDPLGLMPPGADPECFKKGNCKCATAECAAGLPPLPPPDPNAKCKFVVTLVCMGMGPATGVAFPMSMPLSQGCSYALKKVCDAEPGECTTTFWGAP